MAHILDETYKDHELIFIKQENGFITVDVRIDDFDGEMIAGYEDMIDISTARAMARGFVDGWEARKGLTHA